MNSGTYISLIFHVKPSSLKTNFAFRLLLAEATTFYPCASKFLGMPSVM